MELNIEAIKSLMHEKFNGNYNAFARATGVNVSLLYRLLNHQGNAGLNTINKFIAYIKKIGLPVYDYIFLP